MTRLKHFLCAFVFAVFAASPAANAQQNSGLMCLNFTDSYVKVVLKNADPSPQDVQEVVSILAMVRGYAAALQDVFQGRLIGWAMKDDETALLKEIYDFCRRYPNYSFDRAMRSIPQFVDTFKAIQQQEDNRCFNYIFKNKRRICPAPQGTGEQVVQESAPPTQIQGE